MPKLFQSKPGMVKVVDLGDSAAIGVLSISGEGGKLEQQDGVVITQIGINQEVNAQFMPSLQKVIYVYSFGDRMGQIQVNGIAFDKLCNKASRGYVGTNSLFKYYDKNRAIDENRLMKISIGKVAFQGYLISSSLNTASPEFRTMSFSLRIVTVPSQVGFK